MQGEGKRRDCGYKRAAREIPVDRALLCHDCGGHSKVALYDRTQTDRQTEENWGNLSNTVECTKINIRVVTLYYTRCCRWERQGDSYTGSITPHNCMWVYDHLRVRFSLRKRSLIFLNMHTHTNKEQAWLLKHSAWINLGSKTVFNRSKSQQEKVTMVMLYQK